MQATIQHCNVKTSTTFFLVYFKVCSQSLIGCVQEASISKKGMLVGVSILFSETTIVIFSNFVS